MVKRRHGALRKQIRKGASASFLNSTGGRILIVGALIAGAVYAARRVDPEKTAELIRDPINRIRRSLNEGADNGSGALIAATERLSSAFREALRAFRSALDQNGGFTPMARDTVDTASEDQQAYSDAPRTESVVPH